MIAAGRAAVRGWRHLNDRGYIYVWLNVLWALLTLPIVTAPAAWGALVGVSWRMQRDPQVDARAFWGEFRANLPRGLLISLANFVVAFFTYYNLAAYSNVPGVGAIALRVAWVLIPALWLAVQAYAFSIYYAMETPNYVQALRNAALMIALNPLFTLALGVIVVVIAAASTFFTAAWFLITGSALASIVNAAVLDRLRRAGLQQARTIDDPDEVDEEG